MVKKSLYAMIVGLMIAGTACAPQATATLSPTTAPTVAAATTAPTTAPATSDDGAAAGRCGDKS